MSKNKGDRYNEGKPMFDLLPPYAVEQVVRALTDGASKYTPNNWAKGLSWKDTMASLKRHINAWEQGHDINPESGVYHLAHSVCNALYLLEFYKIYPQGDDRRQDWTPRIGLDIDEVLADFVGGLLEHRGWSKRPQSWWFDYDMDQEFERMQKEGVLEDFFLNLKPKISPEDISFDPVCYITSRPIDSDITQRWLLEHNFPNVPVFTTDKVLDKLYYAKQEDLDIFIDDAYYNFKKLNEAGVFCYLMDAPHNQRYNVGHHRLKNISDLKDNWT